MKRLLALVCGLLLVPSAHAQTEIASPPNGGDPLLFTYDSSGSRVPFLIVSNLADEDVVVELAIFPDSLGVELDPHEQRAATEYRTVRGGNVIFDFVRRWRLRSLMDGLFRGRSRSLGRSGLASRPENRPW